MALRPVGDSRSYVGPWSLSAWGPGRLIDFRLPRPLQLRGDFARLAKRAEGVAAEDLPDVVVGVPALKSSSVNRGKHETSSGPTGHEVIPSKSEPIPTWSTPATLMMCSV